ncbi:MAG TPA: FRG domain-containing protein [Terriglobales bacterium]|nr:FRG domain-containing protein [Terriglobales bacterium]
MRRSGIEEIRVESWEEANEALYRGSWNKDIRRFRSDYVFRGLSCADWPLVTALSRLGGNYRELEAHLLRNFRKYARQSVPVVDSEWNWLAIAQHHGLSTRLMDWTYSPFVALHFATECVEAFDTDGIVWCVNYVGVHKMLPSKLRRLLDQERSNAFTVDMLAGAAANLRELEALGHESFALYFEPPSFDERIVNQFALFSMMSDPDAQLGDWLEQHPDLVRRVIIPAPRKWEIRDKLDQGNITERVLFPGLDGLSCWLRRHYMPRAEATSEPAEMDPTDSNLCGFPEKRRVS